MLARFPAWVLCGLVFACLATNVPSVRAPGSAHRANQNRHSCRGLLDEAGKPLAGVRVVFYGEDLRARTHKKLADQETKSNGRFEFPKAPAPSDDRGLAVVVTKPGRGSIVRTLFPWVLAKPLEFKLSPAGTLSDA